MSRKKEVTHDFSLYDLPSTTKDLKAWFDEQVKEHVPITYRGSVRWEFDVDDAPYGRGYVATVYLRYTRPERASERKERVKRENESRKLQEAHELRELKRLQEKYHNG